MPDGLAIGRVDQLHGIGRQAVLGGSLVQQISTIARLEWAASLPPRRITALPLLTQIAAASAVTFGRDS